MRKTFRQLHLWLSVPFGLIITVVCFSGAALVFEDEVMELCHRDLYQVEKVETPPLPLDELMEKCVASYYAGDSSVTTSGVVKVKMESKGKTTLFVDPYTGEVKGESERSPFFLTMFRLHRWLLDSMKPDGGIFWGKMVVGSATLMLIVVLLSGIVIWWPRTKKALKNSLKIVTGKGRCRFWYSLHVAGGLYTLVFLLVMALTGLTWSFSWYRTGFYQAFGVEAPQGGGHGAKSHGIPPYPHEEQHGGGAERPSPYAHWQKVCDELKRLNPDYKQITLSDGAATVSFDGWGNQRAADRYTFNPRNGEITEATLYKDAERSSKIRGWIYSVHVGSWGGMFTRILTFIAALLGATLPLTGYYLWWRRLNRRA